MDRVHPNNSYPPPTQMPNLTPPYTESQLYAAHNANPTLATKGASSAAAGGTTFFKSKIFIGLCIALGVVLTLGLIAGVVLLAIFGASESIKVFICVFIYTF